MFQTATKLVVLGISSGQQLKKVWEKKNCGYNAYSLTQHKNVKLVKIWRWCLICRNQWTGNIKEVYWPHWPHHILQKKTFQDTKKQQKYKFCSLESIVFFCYLYFAPHIDKLFLSLLWNKTSTKFCRRMRRKEYL